MAGCGSNCESIWADIASSILGLNKNMVQVQSPRGPLDSGPSTSSRSIAVVAKLVEQACLSIRKQRLKAPLPITAKGMARAVKNAELDARFKSSPDSSGYLRPSLAAAVVEIETDPVKYVPRIRGVWMAVEAGKIYCEDSARKSLKASVVQALGWAYREQICYSEGAISSEQFENYDIPGPFEIPPINISFIDNNLGGPKGTNAKGQNAKGVGALPFACIPAAYLQAVSQALNYSFTAVPLKAQSILDAGRKA
jgi:CO/xanthine dehydrogenase Mo-binding subunit